VLEWILFILYFLKNASSCKENAEAVNKIQSAINNVFICKILKIILIRKGWFFKMPDERLIYK